MFADRNDPIEGLAGAIFWRLRMTFHATGRAAFALRELGLDPVLPLPAHAENRNAAIILLRRRLEERQPDLRIERAGQGRFRLAVACRLTREEPREPSPKIDGGFARTL